LGSEMSRMLAVLLSSVVLLAAGPSCAATAADITISEMRFKVVRHRQSPDHYIITGVVKNAGGLPQMPGIAQRVGLVRNGQILALQTVPALAAGVEYTVAFAVDRPRAERGTPFPVTLRYVFERGDRARNDCSGMNNALTETF
jgi:hypothetical protein